MKPFALIKLRARELALRQKLRAIEYQIACADLGKLPSRMAPSKAPFAIIQLLNANGPMAVTEIASQVAADRKAVQVALNRLVASGYLVKVRRGVYQARRQMAAAG